MVYLNYSGIFVYYHEFHLNTHYYDNKTWKSSKFSKWYQNDILPSIYDKPGIEPYVKFPIVKLLFVSSVLVPGIA